MVTIPLELNTEQIRGEKRVTFYHLSWLSYQKILQAIGENNRAHLFYDRGTLEITMPLEEHEFY
ncbi:MAG: Uma2 family endonuclease, partial [Microcystis aeruginosa]